MGIYRDVNERLATFNDFSQKRFGQLVRQFEGHTRMLVAMKSDLDQIFRRIRCANALWPLWVAFWPALVAASR